MGHARHNAHEETGHHLILQVYGNLIPGKSNSLFAQDNKTHQWDYPTPSPKPYTQGS